MDFLNHESEMAALTSPNTCSALWGMLQLAVGLQLGVLAFDFFVAGQAYWLSQLDSRTREEGRGRDGLQPPSQDVSSISCLLHPFFVAR